MTPKNSPYHVNNFGHPDKWRIKRFDLRSEVRVLDAASDAICSFPSQNLEMAQRFIDWAKEDAGMEEKLGGSKFFTVDECRKAVEGTKSGENQGE